MPKRSAAAKVVRRSAADIPAAAAADLSRLRDAMVVPIDTSDIAERQGSFSRLERHASGRLPRRAVGK